MNIQETLTSLDETELRRLMSISQKDKSNEAYRATVGILDHADLVDLIAERAKKDSVFRKMLQEMLKKDPMFIDNIIESTSQAAQMLLSGEKLDGTAVMVIKALKENPDLKRRFRKIYYVARSEERLDYDTHYESFSKELHSKGVDYIYNARLLKYFLVSLSIFFVLSTVSRLSTMEHKEFLDYLGTLTISSVGSILVSTLASITLGSLSEAKYSQLGERVDLVLDAIYQFLKEVDENIAKELESPEIEDPYIPAASLLDILNEDKQVRDLDDDGHILGAIES